MKNWLTINNSNTIGELALGIKQFISEDPDNLRGLHVAVTRITRDGRAETMSYRMFKNNSVHKKYIVHSYKTFLKYMK